MATENKVVFGLKNVHYAVREADTNGTPTWGTPKAIPGAVNLSLSAEGDTNDFYADDRKYYTSTTNQGYSGDLEIAKIPDDMLKDIFGMEEGTTSKVLTEKADVEAVEFALLFEIAGDQHAERHVLYSCVATRPEIDGATATETKEPNTQTITITAKPLASGIVRARTTADTPTATYSGWYDDVFVEA